MNCATPIDRESSIIREKSNRIAFVFFLTLLPILLSGRIKSLGVFRLLGIDVTLLALLMLFLGVVLLGFLRNIHFDFGWIRVIGPFFLVYSIAYLSMLSKDAANEKIKFLILVSLPCFILVYFLASTSNGLKNYAFVWLVSGTMVATLTLLTGGTLTIGKRFALGGETLSSGYLMSCSCALSFLFLSSTKSWKKILLFIAFTINLTGLIFNGSRGPIVAAIIGLCLASIVYLRGLRKKILFGLITTILFFLTFSYSPADSKQRFSYLFEDFARREIIQASFKGWLESPFFGHGVDQFKFMFPTQRYPHNFVLEILFETGVLGLFAFLIVIGVAFRKLVSQVNPADFQPVFLVGVINLISHFFSNDITNRYLWISLAPLVFLNQRGRINIE